MSDKLKEFFCSDASPVGKLSEFMAKAVISAEVTIDTTDINEIKTYCWCCTLWRGVLVGTVLGFIVGMVFK